jgi:hypothetical protein
MSTSTTLPLACLSAFGDVTIGTHGKVLTHAQTADAYNRLRDTVLARERDIAALEATVTLLRGDDAAEWVDGLPTESGRHYYALRVREGNRWYVSDILTSAGAVFIRPECYHEIMHKLAPGMPAPPDEEP